MVNNQRKVICIPAKNYMNELHKLVKTANLRILFCSNILTNDTINDVNKQVNSTAVKFINFSKSIEDLSLSEIYDICIIKDYEAHFHFIPVLVEHVQNSGIVLLISNEFDGNQFQMSTFSKRFFNVLQEAELEFGLTDIAKKSSKNLIDNSPSTVCEQPDVLDKLVKSFEETFSSVTSSSPFANSVVIVEGLSGRGKSTTVCSGIASALHFGLADVYVYGPDDVDLKACSDRVRQLLISSFEYPESSTRIRYETKYHVLEITTASVTQKVRFVNFPRHEDSSASKNQATLPGLGVASIASTGLVCVLEAGRLSSESKLATLLSSANPKLAWVTVSTGGFGSVGSHIYRDTNRVLRSFCGIGETIFNEVVEETVSKQSGTLVRVHVNKADRKKFTSVHVSHSKDSETKDELERRVNQIFCLQRKIDEKFDKSSATNFFPEPNHCDLMLVAKDTLFSGHQAAEMMLEKFMDIYTAFDHKRSSSFLEQLVNDSNQHLFCLQQPKKSNNFVPEILCLAHVVIETRTRSSKKKKNQEIETQSSLKKIFIGQTCVRVVRLVTRAKFQKLGYGRHMLKMLRKYFSIDNAIDSGLMEKSSSKKAKRPSKNETVNVHTSLIRSEIEDLPPLLVNVNDARSTVSPYGRVSYMSVTFPASSSDVMCFWRKCQFLPVEIEPISTNRMMITMIVGCQSSQSSSESCVVGHHNVEQLAEKAYAEFCENIGSTLLHNLRDVHVSLAHEILFHQRKDNMTSFRDCTLDDIARCFDNRQLKKLDSFVQNVHSFESVQELFFHIAALYFGRRISDLHLAKYQELTLVGFGFQLKTAKQLAEELIAAERTNHSSDAFGLRKDVLKKMPLLLSHIRECGRVFLNYVTKIIDEHDKSSECPEKKRRLV